MKQTGVPDEAITEFLGYLERHGRGSYTMRSYRLGLEDFSRWLHREGRVLVEVSRADIEAYISEFAAGEGRTNHGVVDLATGEPIRPRRAARTVNHRLSVLASFFGYLIDRDLEGGIWAGRVSPVPARQSGSHTAWAAAEMPRPGNGVLSCAGENPASCPQSSSRSRWIGWLRRRGRGATRRC